MFDSKQREKPNRISSLFKNSTQIKLEKSAHSVTLINESIGEKLPSEIFVQVNNLVKINQTSNEQNNISNSLRVLKFNNNLTTKFRNKTSVNVLITKFRNNSTENSNKMEQNVHLKNIGNKTKRTDSLVNTINKTFENILPTSKEVNNFSIDVVNEITLKENLNTIIKNSKISIEEDIREPQEEISATVAMISLSQVLKDQQTFNRTRMRTNNKNETLKSLGSVDLILPNFNDNGEVKNLNKSFSGEHIVSPARSDRIDIQASSRTDSPMLNYIFDTHANLNKHQHRNDR